MPKDNEVKNLIVNKLTKEQFKTVSDSSTNYEVYHIIDDAHYTETEIQKLLNTKQDVLTAGDGLEIKDGVISNTHSNPKWGDLQGYVFEQLDLKNALYANNIYESNGLVLTDEQGFNDVQKYAHSTFDLSKFEVVGSPNVTSDGVASGFTSQDYFRLPLLKDGGQVEKIRIKFNLLGSVSTESRMIARLHETGLMIYTNNIGNINVAQPSSFGAQYFFNVQPKDYYADCIIEVILNKNSKELFVSYYENDVLISSKTVSSSMPSLLNIDNWTTEMSNSNGYWCLGYQGFNGGFLGSIDLKQISITVDGKEVFDGNKTGLDVIKEDNYTVVGTANISEDGVITCVDGINYVEIPCNFADDFEFEISWTNRPDKFWWGYLIQAPLEIYHYHGNGKFQINLRHSGTFSTICDVRYIKGAKYKVRIKKTSDSLVVDAYINNELSVSGTFDLSEAETLPTNTTIRVCDTNFGTQDPTMFYPVEVDLNNIKVKQYDELYQPCLKIPYTESKTGSKIVDAVYRDRVEDVYEQYGQANYYTLDEENKNFTLPMGEIYGMIEDKQYQLDDKVSLTKDEIITGQKTFENNITINGNNVNIMPTAGDGSIDFSDGERIRFAQGGQTVISANNTSIYLRTKSNRDGANQVELKTDGTLSAIKFKGPLDGIATQATKDSSGLQINTTYMRKTIGTQGIPHTPTAPTYLEMVGRQGCGNGNIAGGNLVALHKNTLYKCNERGSTITCNYDDKVANLGKSMCDGSFSGHYPAINPSTSFTSKPFTWEVTSSSQYEVSDVCRLHIYSHRLTDPINVTKFKIEAYIHDTLTNSKKWITAYEYSGESKNIAQTGYGLYISGYSSNSYYSIYGIRLTISESPDTVFRLSEIQLVASRGTETIADSLHCVSDAGGKIWGNLEVTGTVNGKCTKDGNGNVIVDTYATKTEVGGKQDTLTAGTGINISNNTISTTFTDTKVQSNVSNANSNVPILLNNGTSATTNVALINSLINANPSTGTINAQHGKFGKSLTTYRYVASETPNTTYYWYKIYSSSTSDEIVNFEISAHGDANYPYFSKYTISISNYRATTTSVVVHNHGITKNSDIKVAIDAQGNVYLQTNCLWNCNLNVNNTYGTATIPYENMGYSSFGVPVGFASLGMLTNCGAMRLTKSTGEVQYSNVTTSSIADGVKAKSGQILYDWVGTKEEYEAGIANGTISEDWICWITDDNTGTYETNKYDLFDVVIKDHILGYEESFGFGKLGTYVYKKPKLNEYLGYPDFYNKCLEEYNEVTERKTIKHYLSSNVTKISGLKDKKGIISNFSTSSYAQIPALISGMGYFEFQIKFKLTNNAIINTLIATSVTYDGLMLRINANGVLTAYVSSNGTSWNIMDGVLGSHVYQTDTDYWLKCIYNGNGIFTFSYSTNGKDFVTDITGGTDGSLMYSATTLYNLGLDDSKKNPLGGSIDLKECYLKQGRDIDEDWSGVNYLEFNYKQHPNGHRFFDIADKPLVDTFYNLTKIAWFYGIDTKNECIFLPRNDYLTSYVENSENSVLYDMQTLEAMRMRIPLSDGLGRINMLFNGVSSSDNTEGLTGANSATDFGRVRYTGTSYKTSDLIGSGTTSTVTPNTVNLDPNGTLYVDIKNTNDSNRYAYMVVGNTVSDTSWVDVVTQVNSGVKELEDKTNEGIKTLSNASNALKQTQITNCLLEVPQKIKLELNNGVLTLKAGSKVIVPNGVGVFDEVAIENDLNVGLATNVNFANKQFTVCVSYNGKSIERIPYQESGDGSSYTNAWEIYYNVSANRVYTVDNRADIGNKLSLPIALITLNSDATGWASIDQVFNGFGYIGSTVWVDKGVKGLIPNGKNEDGSLKNIEFVTGGVLTCSVQDKGVVGFRGNAVGVSGVYSFDEANNQNLNSGSFWNVCTLGNLEYSDGKITSFNPKQPFRAVDYSEFTQTPHIIETYQNGTSWYRVYSDGWCEQGGITSPWYRSTENIITFLKKFKSKPTFICNLEVTTGEATEMRVTIGNATNNAGVDFITNTQATVYIHGISGSGTDGGPVHWEAKGYIS